MAPKRKGVRTLESLSRKQRQGTPLPFALHLLARVRAAFGVERVACLWVAEQSVYHTLPGCDCWPESRDAMTFEGPGPIIAHPHCGPWGKYRSKCFHDPAHGIRAMELVHRFGGVVEQPVGSRLFREHGEWWGHEAEQVDQVDYGHLAQKATLLYWVLKPKE